MVKVEEIEARRAARKAQVEQAKAEQYATDLEAIDALEVESGEELATLTVNGYKAGLPVLVGVKAPNALQYKRFADQIRNAKENVGKRAQAQDLLAESCWVYPSLENKEQRKAMLDAFPGILVSIAVEVAKLAELKSADEGKG